MLSRLKVGPDILKTNSSHMGATTQWRRLETLHLLSFEEKSQLEFVCNLKIEHRFSLWKKFAIRFKLCLWNLPEGLGTEFVFTDFRRDFCKNF